MLTGTKLVGMPLSPEIEIVASQVIQAKIQITAQEGIGEPLKYTLHGWHHGAAVVVAEFPRLFGQLNTLSMLVGSTAIAMRKIFGIESLTFSGEGFMARSYSDVDLAVRFASGDMDVQECLQVCHVEPDEYPHLMSIPFKYALGREIEVDSWIMQPITPSGISLLLQLALTLDVEPTFDLSEIVAAGVVLYDYT